MAQLAKYSLMLILLGGIIGCSKEGDKLDDYSEDFRFYLNTEIDGRTVQYYAGENGYELATDYSFEDNVVVMKGTLAREDYLRRGAFEIEIRSRRTLSSEGTFDMNADLQEGKMSFSNPSSERVLPDEFNLTLLGQDLTGDTEYSWTFEDRSQADGNPVEKRVSAKDQSSFYTELRASSIYCESYLKKDIHLQKENCKVEMNITGMDQSDLKASIISISEVEIRSVEWFFNEEAAGNKLDLEFKELDFSLNGDYYITAVVHLENDCVSTISRKINVSGGSFVLCYNNFDYTLESATVSDPKQLGTARITYYNESGKEYTSYYTGNSRVLELAAIKPFKSNEKGQATLSFLFEGEMTLVNPEDSSEIKLGKCFGNMAVAHP